MSRATRGSWLIVSSGHYEDKELAGRLQQTATHTRFWNHNASDLASMLAGLDPVAPGVCEVHRWMAGTGGEPTGKPVYALAAVGVKSASPHRPPHAASHGFCRSPAEITRLQSDFVP